MGAIFATLAHTQSDARPAPCGIEDDGCPQARFSGRDDTAILSRQRTARRDNIGLEPSGRRGGVAEYRTGMLCLGAQSACSGRKRWEAHAPEAAEALRQLAEAHAQQDPTFRTTLAYTRLTAKAAGEALRAQGVAEEHLPSPSTMAEVLNRMGYRLRKVIKAKPQKKIKETDAIFDNIKKRPHGRGRGAGQTLEHGL